MCLYVSNAPATSFENKGSSVESVGEVGREVRAREEFPQVETWYFFHCYIIFVLQ